VLALADRGVLLGSELRLPTAVNLGFTERSRYFIFQLAPHPHEAEWTPFPTQYFTENLVVSGI
jgi:hypothetical protein